MVVLLPFTVNLYHDGLFQVNPLEYVHFNRRVIDDVSFDNSDSDGETNVPLDDVAHVVEQFEHENEGNVNIPRITTDHPWLNYTIGSTCVLENEVNDEDGKLYFGRDYLNLGDEGGISIISDGHKTGYPMLSTNSVPGTFMPISRRDEVGLQFKRLFWGAAATSMKLMDKGSAAFENGISKSFNSRIIGARGKPIITMLEDIRVYIMQRMFSMNKLAFDNKDSITPSVRRQMKYNKKIQRYMHMKMNPDYGVAEWYSQCKWYEAYQYSIKPVYGPKF
ncbi:hypothetical protein Tco_0979547 [Tanacetum coccineum]